jgi:hypothetical protein
VDIESPTPPPPLQAPDGSSEGKDTIVLQTLPDDRKTCAICLCDYVDREEVCLSRNPKCSHFFHSACGVEWLLAKHSECPICRAEFIFEADDLKKASEISSQEDSGNGGTAASPRGPVSEIEESSEPEGAVENQVAS